MNHKMHDVMQRAARLTRSGLLHEATAAIQQALTQGRPAGMAAGARDFVDVEARIVPDVATPNGAAAQPLPQPGSFSVGRFSNAAGKRSYKLYRPRRQPADGSAPGLVVMLHGCTQNPDDFAAGTGMNELAEARGWWVLYPAQSKAANSSGCWNWFKRGDQQRGQGEPAILAGMTEDIVRSCGIDPQRVFVAGLSAGGAMAVILAATHPELFAAVGAHSGLPHGSAHDLTSALSAMRQGAAGQAGQAGVPTIVFHGDKDSTVHPSNAGAVLRQARAGGAGAAHAEDEAGIETERGVIPGGHRYTRSLHRNAQGQVDAEHWLVHGAGHAWSGGRSAGSFTDPRGPDASAEMLRFFDAQRSR